MGVEKYCIYEGCFGYPMRETGLCQLHRDHKCTAFNTFKGNSPPECIKCGKVENEKIQTDQFTKGKIIELG